MAASGSRVGRFVRPHTSRLRGQRRIIPFAACLVVAALVPRPTAAGLVLWWQFSGSGTAVNGATTLADSSTSGYAGTFSSSGTGSAVFETVTYGTSGVTGTGLNFGPQASGNGSWVAASGSGAGVRPNLDFGTGDFSVSMWIRKQATSNSQWANTNGVNLTSFGLGPGYSPGFENPFASIGTGFSVGSNVVAGTNAFVTSATAPLTHVVTVRSGNRLALYFDGVLSGSINQPLVGSALVSATSRLDVNLNPSGAQYQSNATFSNLQIYNEALTAGQVAALYSQPLVVVPEPGPTMLVAVGVAAMAWAVRRRRAVPGPAARRRRRRATAPSAPRASDSCPSR